MVLMITTTYDTEAKAAKLVVKLTSPLARKPRDNPPPRRR